MICLYSEPDASTKYYPIPFLWHIFLSTPGYSKWFPFFRFINDTLYAFFCSTVRSIWTPHLPPHLILLDFMNRKYFMSFTAPEAHTYEILFILASFLPLRPKCFLQEPLFSTHNTFSLLNVKDQVWCLCTSRDQIIILYILVFTFWMAKERENLQDRVVVGRVVSKLTRRNLQLTLYIRGKYS
jgi:hypothetical protein